MGKTIETIRGLKDGLGNNVRISFLINSSALSDLSDGLPIRECYIMNYNGMDGGLYVNFHDYQDDSDSISRDSCEMQCVSDKYDTVDAELPSWVTSILVEQIANELEMKSEELQDEDCIANVICTSRGCKATWNTPPEWPEFKWYCGSCNKPLEPNDFISGFSNLCRCTECGQINRVSYPDD